jgi:hypothetical protein
VSVPRAAVEEVVAARRDQRVVAVVAPNIVISGVAVDRVVAVPAADRVIAAVAVDDVVVVGAVDGVLAIAAVICGHVAFLTEFRGTKAMMLRGTKEMMHCTIESLASGAKANSTFLIMFWRTRNDHSRQSPREEPGVRDSLTL